MPSMIQHHTRLALLTAMLAGLGAQAQAAEPLLSAASSLSGLSFQLIDLDPTDGISPSLTMRTDGGFFTAPLESYDSYGGYISFGAETFTLLPLVGSTSGSPFTVLTQGSAPESFSSTATSVRTNAQLSTSDLKTVSYTETVENVQGPTILTSTTVKTSIYGGSYSKFDLPGEIGGQNPDTGEWINTLSGRLSANTALIITGQANVSLRADNRSLAEGLNNALGSNENAYLTGDGGRGSVSGQISLSLLIGSESSDSTSSASNSSSSYFDMSDGVSFDAFALTRYNPISGVIEPIDGPVTELNTSRNFSLVAFNNSANVSDLAFGMYLNSGVDQDLTTAVGTLVSTDNPNWVPDTPTPVIPEPSTYALMGLGLVGIAQVARRRKANG